MKKLYALLGLFLLSSIAIAAAPVVWYPEDGTWRNPAAPGRNFKIDVQDEVLILNVFGYRADGSAVWYQAAQVMENVSNGNKYFSATLNEYKDGQCSGCPYTQPVLLGPNGGDISIMFTSPSHASVSWAGESFNIERSDVVVGKLPESILGTWIVVSQVFGAVSISEIIEMNYITDPSTTPGSTGRAAGIADLGDIAISECFENAPDNLYNNKCLLGIVDTTTQDLRTLYILTLSINRGHGIVTEPSSPLEFPAWISRIAGRSATLSNSAPIKSGIEHQASELSEGQRGSARAEAGLLNSSTMSTEEYDEIYDIFKRALLQVNEARD